MKTSEAGGAFVSQINQGPSVFNQNIPDLDLSVTANASKKKQPSNSHLIDDKPDMRQNSNFSFQGFMSQF